MIIKIINAFLNIIKVLRIKLNGYKSSYTIKMYTNTFILKNK